MTDTVTFVPLTGWSNVFYDDTTDSHYAMACPGLLVEEDPGDPSTRFVCAARIDEMGFVESNEHTSAYRGTYRDDEIPDEVERLGFVQPAAKRKR